MLKRLYFWIDTTFGSLPFLFLIAASILVAIFVR